VSLRCAPGRASRAVGNETTVANGADLGDSAEEHRLSHAEQAEQHLAFGVTADADALQRDGGVFDHRVAAGEFGQP
jgi:hypothetical protein